MTTKEKRIDLAMSYLNQEVRRCKNMYKQNIKEDRLIRAYEDKVYVETIQWVVDTIEYWLEEGKAP